MFFRYLFADCPLQKFRHVHFLLQRAKFLVYGISPYGILNMIFSFSSLLFFSRYLASQSPHFDFRSIVGYTLLILLKFCLPFAFQLRRVILMIIFHFNFLLILINPSLLMDNRELRVQVFYKTFFLKKGRKKVADKNTTDLKGQKIRTNQNTLKTFLLRTDYFSARITYPFMKL